MAVMLSDLRPKARKEYNCCAWSHIREALIEKQTVFTFSDLRHIAKAKKENGKILPGTVYVSQTHLYDGSFARFRARPELHRICCEYELYNYDED